MVVDDITGGLFPHRRRFELHEVARLPIEVSEAAQIEIDRSSAEGRKFPLALSEAFGTIPGLTLISLDAVSRPEHLQTADAPDVHPVTGEAITHLYKISIYRGQRLIYTWHINGADAAAVHPNGHPVFVARTMADELVRLFRIAQKLKGEG